MDQLYESYATTHASFYTRGSAVAALRRQVCPLLPQARSARILDVGCGQGELLSLLRRTGYERVSGIDISEDQLVAARTRGVEAQRADLFEYLPHYSRTFDAIVVLDVLEHLPKHRTLEALAAMAGALRPSGRVVGRVPNGDSPFVGRYRYGDFTHTTAFTRRSLHQVFLASGFAQVHVAEVRPVVHGVASAVRFGAWQLASGAMKAALAAETGVLRGHLVTQNVVFVAVVESARGDED
jgi:2-polyprenyl-3-methyl-5-hydroxy-6-metoxy-1,4-benzoquinol methylase